MFIQTFLFRNSHVVMLSITIILYVLLPLFKTMQNHIVETVPFLCRVSWSYTRTYYGLQFFQALNMIKAVAISIITFQWVLSIFKKQNLASVYNMIGQSIYICNIVPLHYNQSALSLQCSSSPFYLFWLFSQKRYGHHHLHAKRKTYFESTWASPHVKTKVSYKHEISWDRCIAMIFGNKVNTSLAMTLIWPW